jgi:hypothetical protein
MKIFKVQMVVITAFTLIGLSGCGTSKNHLLKVNDSQVKMRSIQTRAFDTTNKTKMLRTVISTLQDLGFVMDQADEVLGTVSATKLDKKFSKNSLQITVTVRRRGETQLLVRANLQYAKKSVENPAIYQDFFTALAKSMFLTAHMI